MKANVKIIDFGFAAKIEKSGLKYTTLGSPINMDPIILNELKKKGKKTRKLGYDQRADIWSLGTICYEMLIGKCVFDAEDLDDLVQKVENGTYTVPTSLSREVISFLNGMLQYNANERLNINQLAKHNFLTKKVKDFESLDMKKVSKKNMDKSRLKINVKKNKSIWAIFNEEDEDKLMKIKADCYDKPIDEQKSYDFKNQKSNNIQNNNVNKNNVQNNNVNKNNVQNNNVNKNNIKNNNDNNYVKKNSKSNHPVNQQQQQNRVNPLPNQNAGVMPNMNYPYAIPQQNYPGMVGNYAYQRLPGMPMQGMVGMPMMAYPQMQPVQGYGIYGNAGYYK
jgi:serine/threonine protein kinase